jgi:hypothetical protein
MQAKGINIVGIALQGRYSGIVLGVYKNRAAQYKSPKDLKGWKIGVTAPGSSTNMMVSSLLAKDGLKPDAVSIIGVCFGLATMITFAAMVILSARQPAQLGPMGRAGAPMIVAAVLYLFVVPPWAFPYDKLDDVVMLAGRFPLEVPLWTTLVWIVVLGSVVPFSLILGGNARVGSGAASMLGMTEPVVGSIAAWVILGQLLSLVQMLQLLLHRWTHYYHRDGRQARTRAAINTTITRNSTSHSGAAQHLCRWHKWLRHLTNSRGQEATECLSLACLLA